MTNILGLSTCQVSDCLLSVTKMRKNLAFIDDLFHQINVQN